MAKKRFGQHFLTDPNILRKIAGFSGVASSDVVVEIGPGKGGLTRELAARAARVIAVEIDRDLTPELRRSTPANVDIVEADALTVVWEDLTRERFHIVANLPYNVATPLMQRFVDARSQIQSATVMLQKEVAQRILAPPGSPERGPLSVFIQYHAAPVFGFTIGPGAFWPKPRVSSAVIRLAWREGVPDAVPVMRFVQRMFGSRRKKLINNLRAFLPNAARDALQEAVNRAGLDPNARPEQLSVGDFLRLYEVLSFPAVSN